MIELTIVTVTFNNIEGLKRTLNSVEELLIPSFEHIIIDGASSDGTIEYLSSFDNYPLSINSEKDHGIYDAMNKGIDLAKGRWILFMNAGDELYSAEFSSNLIHSTSDILYGSALAVYENGFKREIKPKRLKKLWKGMSFSHQAVIGRSSLLKNKKFNLEYKYCADFDLIYSAYLKGLKLEKLDIIIAKIEAGGVSDTKRHKATAEVFKINRRQENSFKIYPYFIAKIIYGYLSSGIKKVLPKSLVNSLVKAKYK